MRPPIQWLNGFNDCFGGYLAAISNPIYMDGFNACGRLWPSVRDWYFERPAPQ